jgi:hypothetical protein
VIEDRFGLRIPPLRQPACLSHGGEDNGPKADGKRNSYKRTVPLS